jgi:hypothetical protein
VRTSAGIDFELIRMRIDWLKGSESDMTRQVRSNVNVVEALTSRHKKTRLDFTLRSGFACFAILLLALNI